MSTKRHVAAAVAALALGSAALYSQNRPVPRTPWGTPDLQGVWSFATVTPLERPQGVTSEFLTADEIQKIERQAIAAATVVKHHNEEGHAKSK